MRTPWFAVLILVTVPLVASSQESLPDSSLIAKLMLTKSDLPRGSSSTCLAVFSDGHFHMEEHSDWPASGPRIFEDSLPGEILKSLSTILEVPEIKELGTTEKIGPAQQPLHGAVVAAAQSEAFWAVIPRNGITQELVFIAWEGSAGRLPNPFPASLDPLIQWVQSTKKALDKRKMRPLKDGKSVKCWLPRR